MRGRRRARRRSGELRRPGRAPARPVRQAGRHGRAWARRSRPRCRPTWSNASGPPQHRGPAQHRGLRAPAETGTSKRSRCATGATGATEDVDDELVVRLHRRPAAHRLARRRPSRATSTGSSSPGRTAGSAMDAAAGPTAQPYPLETSVPGVFAAGDVRLDSMKRVASAVGEGAMAVYLRPPLPGDDLMALFEERAGARAVRRARGRAAVDDDRRVARRSPSPVVTSCWTRVSPRTSGGCCSRAASSSSGRCGRRQMVRRDRSTRLAAGRAVSWPGTAAASTWRPGRARVPGRVLRVPAPALARAPRPACPLVPHFIEGLFPTARSIEASVRVARGARGARHPVGRSGARAQQPGRRRPPVRSTRSRGHVRTSLTSLRRPRRRMASRPRRSRPLDALRLEPSRSPWSLDALAVADREEALVRLAGATTASSGTGCSRPPWRRPASRPVVRPGARSWSARRRSSPRSSGSPPRVGAVALLGEVRESTRRVSTLVAAVKSYSQMDRAARQRIDVDRGDREHPDDARSQAARGGHHDRARLRRRPPDARRLCR